MATTAKIVCTGKTPAVDGEQVQLNFQPDYEDGRNKEWARYTPALSLVMSVKPEVAEQFEQGQRFTLTFDASTD